MKVLIISGYSIAKAYEYRAQGNEHQGHHLYGYDFLKENSNIEIENLIPDYGNKLLKYFSRITKLGDELFRLHLQLNAAKLSKNFDIVYSPQDIHLPLLALLRMLKVCRCPVFAISHFAYNSNLVRSKVKRFYKKCERAIFYRGIDKISFLNETLLNLAMKDYKVPMQHRDFLNWGADLAFFQNYSKEMKNPPTLDFFAGIGSANRDYETLVRAFANENFKLKIFGRNDESVNIKPEIPTNVVFDNSIKPGIDSVSKLREQYYNSIAILIPLLDDNDVSNGATVFIEALAMGKPIIITDLRTNYHDVEEAGIGFKIKKGDIEGWTNAIKWIMSHPLEMKIMGEKSLALANEKYNYEMFSSNLISIINSFQRKNKSIL